MKKVIIIGGRNITLTGLKKEIEVIDRGFHELTHINSYQKELTGIIGISENSSTFMTLFSLNQPKEGWKERREIIYSELPDTIDLFTFRGIIKPIINEYFNTYVSIRDSRRTPDADLERREKGKQLQIEREKENKEREDKINLSGEGTIDLKDNQMFITITACSDCSDLMSDYFDRHHTISCQYVLRVVPKGNETEQKLRDAIAGIEEFKELQFDWHTEKYSMGHGNYLESKVFGHVKYGSDENKPYHFEIKYSTYNKSLPKSRFYTDNTFTPEPSGSTVSENGITVRRNIEQNGIEILFPSKPDSSILSELKSNGWRWSMRNKVWYKKYSDYAMEYANSLSSNK